MCSWVNRKDGRPPTDLRQFVPQRPTKNIVYYADRVRELETAPALAYHSPHKVRVKQESGDIIVDSLQGRSVGTDIALAVNIKDAAKKEAAGASISVATKTSSRKVNTHNQEDVSVSEMKPTKKRKLK